MNAVTDGRRVYLAHAFGVVNFGMDGNTWNLQSLVPSSLLQVPLGLGKVGGVASPWTAASLAADMILLTEKGHNMTLMDIV